MIGAVASLSEWEAEVNAHCKMEAAGTSASQALTEELDGHLCYNVPYFDTSNGTFAIDLRFYRRPGSQQPPSLLMCACLEFADAVVEDELLPHSTERLASVGSEYMVSAAEVHTMHVWRFVARLNRERLMEEDLQPFLLPTVRLRIERGQETVNITRTADQIVRYVVGNFAPWEARVEPPYAIPGRHIGTFPTGWIIYSVHLVVMLAVLARGTLLRRMDRKQSQEAQADRELSFIDKHTASAEEESKEQEFIETGVAM